MDTSLSPGLARAATLLELNRPREAAEFASKAVAASPSDPLAWLLLARSYEELDEPGRALETVNRAIGLDPHDPDGHLLASRVLLKLNTPRESVRAAEVAVRLAPLSAGTHARLAISLCSFGRGESFFGHFLPRHMKTAASHAAQAIALAPTSSTGHFAAGYVAAAAKRTRHARVHYQRVLAIDPVNAAALNNIALLDLRSGRLSRSGSGFRRALLTDPTMRLARRNVRIALHTSALIFHVMGWFIYSCFSGIAANQQSGPLIFSWTTRSAVAAWLAGIYAVAALIAYKRLDRQVRAFAKRLIIETWPIKLVLVMDAVMVPCFVISTLGRGPIAADVYLWGLLAIGPAYIGFILAKRGYAAIV